MAGSRLIAAKAGFRPATVRHLLTHTAGVRAVRTPLDLFRPALRWGARVGRPAPSLDEYYRGGLRVDVEPGTKWAQWESLQRRRGIEAQFCCEARFNLVGEVPPAPSPPSKR